MSGRPEQGLRTIEDAIVRVGRTPTVLAELGTLLARLGRPEEARGVLDELIELGLRRYVSGFHEAAVYHALGEEEELRRCFDRLVAERSPMIMFLSDPSWLDVGEQDWCRALLSRAGVP
jgi:hypothetical protein